MGSAVSCGSDRVDSNIDVGVGPSDSLATSPHHLKTFHEEQTYANVDDSIATASRIRASQKLTPIQEKKFVGIIMDLEHRSSLLDQGLKNIIQKIGDDINTAQ